MTYRKNILLTIMTPLPQWPFVGMIWLNVNNKMEKQWSNKSVKSLYKKILYEHQHDRKVAFVEKSYSDPSQNQYNLIVEQLQLLIDKVERLNSSQNSKASPNNNKPSNMCYFNTPNIICFKDSNEKCFAKTFSTRSFIDWRIFFTILSGN